MPETRSLPCPLTDEEILARATDAAKLAEKRDLHEIDVKAAAKQGAEDVKAYDHEIRRLHRQVRDRAEYRDIEVDHVEDDTRGVIETRRLDTGAIIASRPMTADEIRDARQAALPGIGKRGRKDAH